MPGDLKAWVTVVLNEEEVVEALVLGQTLRRFRSKWSTVVLTNQHLTDASRNALEVVFDVVVPIGTHHLKDVGGSGMSLETYAKICCWNLPFAKRCIFVQPDTIILKNSDELMESSGLLVSFDKKGSETSLFVFNPSWTTFKSLIEIYSSNGIQTGISGVIEKCWGKDLRRVENKLLLAVDPEEPLPILDVAEASILRLVGLGGKKLRVYLRELETNNLLKNVTRDWMETYEMDVKPLLNGVPKIFPKHHGGIQEPIAIVGMGCRLPGANNLAEFWDLLIEGRDAIGPLPQDRLPPGVTQDPSRGMKAGYLKCPIDRFDGKFFGISPLELSFLDPQTRILTEVLWEALEDAAIDPMSIKGTDTGIFTGAWTQDYKELINSRALQPTQDFFRKYMGNAFGASAGRLSFILGATGPNIATESGCSSSMVALNMACNRLHLRETGLALACGVNLVLHHFEETDMGSICAPDGHCKTFDASADGFGRAEGCGVLVLKRYSDAIKDGDRVHALIRGMGASQEGVSRSLGTPTVECESSAMKMALRNAGTDPSEISYVEAHGTGTPVGDPLEISAIAEAYSTEHRTDQLIVGSVKTNIGHTESCSGITGIIKTVLSLQNEIIPQHQNFEKLNPAINLDSIPAKIPLNPVPWPRLPGKARIAGVSSFGITGTDAHAIIQEAPSTPPTNLDFGVTRPQHLLTLSAKSEQALDELLVKYQNQLETGNPELGNVAFTANTGRAHFNHRVGIVGKNSEEICKNIRKNAFARGKTTGEEKPRVCFLFTGQGSQYSGMGKSLYESSPVFKAHFDACQSILRRRFGVNILPVLWGEDEELKSQISRTIYSQTSIFCIEYCLLKLYESWGVKPDVVLGHSLGEFAVATAAGILNLEDALTLVAERSRLIDVLPRGQMIVLRSNKATVDQLIKQFKVNSPELWLDTAAVNSSEQTVLAGEISTVQKFAEFCTNNKIQSVILEATHAFHSRLMDPMLEEYAEIASKIRFNLPTCKFISGMTGKHLEAGEMNAEYWVQHTREAVRFVDACKVAYDEGCRIFVEIGPQPVLSALTMVNSSGFGSDVKVTCLPSLRRNTDEWGTLLGSLSKLYVSGVQINWRNFDKFYPREKVTLPTYPFQRKRHWFDSTSQGNLERFQFFGGEMHPLVGGLLPNATPTAIYHGLLDLSRLPYVRDHLIGEAVIFPGAGFLEMSLAAAYVTTQGLTTKFEFPSDPISFENLIIEAPLELRDKDGDCRVQILVTPDESSGSVVTVYRELNVEDGGRKQWIRHTSGKYFPFATDHEQDAQFLREDLPGIRKRVSDERNPAAFYMKSREVGLNFGATFRTLKRYWKNAGSREVFAEVETPLDSDQYLCHPLLIDSMIQAFIVTKHDVIPNLTVPVQIGKFVWFSKVDTPVVYLHCYPKEISAPVDLNSVAMYSSNGTLLALMTGIVIVETSVSSVLSTLSNQNRIVCPPLYEDIWKSELGPLQNRPDLNTAFGVSIFPLNSPSLDRFNEERKIDVQLYPTMDRLCLLYIQKAFCDIGWKPEVGDILNAAEFCKKFGILDHFHRLVNRLFMILGEEGYLSGIKGPNEQYLQWTVNSKAVFPEISEISTEIKITEKLLGRGTPEFYAAIDVLATCGEQLGRVFQGQVSPVDIMFTRGDATDEESKAEVFYRESTFSRYMIPTEKAIFRQLIEKYLEVPENATKSVLRILEVGAGTGSLTKLILPILEELNVNFNYTYTDVSSGFFAKAEQVFQSYGKKMRYRVLDLEKDPLEQGFGPGEYDLVLSVNVLHICKQLSHCIQNLRHVTRAGGLLFISETTTPTREVDLTFGLFDGYWQYEDLDLRPNHCLIDLPKWENLLKNNGYDAVSTIPMQKNRVGITIGRAGSGMPTFVPPKTKKSWIIFSGTEKTSQFFKLKLETSGRRVVTIKRNEKIKDFQNRLNHHYEICPYAKDDLIGALENIKEDNNCVEGIIYLWGEDETETDQKSILEPFLYLSQQIVVRGLFRPIPRLFIVTNGVCQAGENTVLNNPAGATLWGFARSLRNELLALQCKSIDMDPGETSEQKLEEAFMEMWTRSRESQVAFRERAIFAPRIVSTKLNRSALSLPLNSERFCLALPASKAINDLKFVPSPPTSELNDDEVEVEIRTFALNFKDVLIILKPIKEFETLNSVGIDFAGVVSAVGKNVRDRKVGDAVFGCNFNGGAMPSYTAVDSNSVVSIPPNWTFAEAVTLPVVFATAYFCMVNVADIQRNETILIHAASGGVGLCAIQLAKHLGLPIIATAGNNRKRAYLKNLGVQHVFNSRTLDYETEVKKATDGRGVDMVLNCLTGPGFKEASLNVCAPGARFVEMSKIDVWQTDEVATRRPDVTYTLVDLTYESKSVWQHLLSKMCEFMKSDILKPIPYTRFEVTHVREALNHLQKAKHIGKVIVEMPLRSKSPIGQIQTTFNLFNEESTYLITGGLGGIGLEVAKWMAESGAKHIVLVGRSAPNSKASETIAELTKQGKHVLALRADVGDIDQCGRLLAALKDPFLALPPLRGIQHAAGNISDALLDNQNWSKFESTVYSKVKGGWNLHILTKEYSLEHFVLYSSVVGILGNAGQTNHAAGNAFLDALAFYRASIGLSALTVNWGQWGEVGVAAEIKANGIRPFSPKEGIHALEILMKSHKVQGCVLEADFAVYRKTSPHLVSYLEEIKIKNSTTANVSAERETAIDSNIFKEELSKSGGDVRVVTGYVERIMRQILKLDGSDEIDGDQGWNSLFIVELVELTGFCLNRLKPG